MKNVGVSCPYCNAIAKIVDGLYEIVEGSIKSANLKVPASRQSEIVAFLKSIKPVEKSEEVTEQIRAQAPELLPIIEKIPSFLKDHGYQIIAILLAILAYFKDDGNTIIIDDRNIQIQDIINNYNTIVAPNEGIDSQEQIVKKRPNRKIQPYEKCWCDSGRTYRSCHGRK